MTTAAYQGEPGSNSATAARALYPEGDELACTSFEQALEAVTLGAADVAVIPVDNSAAGRVADVHHLLPETGLFIVAEYFLAIRFDLMGVPGATLDQVECVRSHVHALGQCRKVLREGGWRTRVSDDTAGAAREVAELGDPRHAALAPPAAARLYGLDVLRPEVEDDPDNTTRFVVLSRDAAPTPHTGEPTMTSLFFCVRNIPIRFDLMGVPGATLDQVECVRSHVHALGQCRKVLREGGWRTRVSDDTAGAAREVAELGDPRHAALAPPAAARLYGLDVLRPEVEDDPDNTTRFVVLSRDAAPTPHTGEPTMTSLFFCVRNIPSALYKALGGFASSGVNLTKIESYQMGAGLNPSRFYVEIEGHPDEERVALALHELRFYSTEVRTLGVYPAHPHRLKN